MVKIEKKRGIKKIKITHNKTLFWIIIALIVILALLIIMIILNKPANTVINKPNECLTDKDCVKVQLGCCPCSMGGEEKCVFVSEQEKYNEILKKCDLRTICSAMYACNIQSCSCVNNKCIPSKS